MRIVFMGTPKAAVPSLARILQDGHEVAAVYTQPDRPSGRGSKIAFSAIKDFALQNSLGLMQPLKIKTVEAIDEFKSQNADLVVVVAYGRILPDAYLHAFPKGAINVHFSLLPKYRGAAPVNWAIVKGESRTGVTTMQMDAGLDTGDILLKRAVEIGPRETSVELMDRLSFVGADLLSETLAMYDELTAQPQNGDEASFAPIMKREDGLIDWSMTAEQITNRIRGFQPFPSSFTYYDGQKITLWSAEAVSGFGFQVSSEGRVVDAKGDLLLIACGGGTVLQIDELQIEGKRRMLTRDVLNGLQIKIGDAF